MLQEHVEHPMLPLTPAAAQTHGAADAGHPRQLLAVPRPTPAAAKATTKPATLAACTTMLGACTAQARTGTTTKAQLAACSMRL